MAPFTIAPLGDVKSLNNYPEYISALQELERVAFARAATIWDGATPGGIIPGAGQFGIGPFRKNDMSGDTVDNTPSGSYTYRINIATANAWRDLFNYTVRNEMIHAFAGWLFSDGALVADQKTSILQRMYVESTGFQRVVPLGFQLWRRPDLVLSEV